MSNVCMYVCMYVMYVCMYVCMSRIRSPPLGRHARYCKRQHCGSNLRHGAIPAWPGALLLPPLPPATAPIAHGDSDDSDLGCIRTIILFSAYVHAGRAVHAET